MGPILYLHDKHAVMDHECPGAVCDIEEVDTHLDA